MSGYYREIDVKQKERRNGFSLDLKPWWTGIKLNGDDFVSAGELMEEKRRALPHPDMNLLLPID